MRGSQPDRDTRTLTQRRAIHQGERSCTEDNQRLLDLHALQVVRDREVKAKKVVDQPDSETGRGCQSQEKTAGTTGKEEERCHL